MGRPTREIQVDPVAGNVYVDTQYDAAGRVWKVSQPYRSGENPVWTTTTYHALDRPMSAAGPAVTQTAEAGNPRRMTNDALGHLVKVEERTRR